MHTLKKKDIVSLKLRGYIKKNLNCREIEEYRSSIDLSVINNLNEYDISSESYMSLFSGLETNCRINLLRYMSLNWNNLANNLKDIQINFKDITHDDILVFFLNSSQSHRVYFFVEIIHQYFFP